jgi:hypothetical protein
MSDTGDEQDVAEGLNSEVLSDYDDPEGNLDYPPDEPMGVEDYGTTAAEERVDEPLAERVARELPDSLDESERPVGRLLSPGADDTDLGVYAIYADEESDAIALSAVESDLTAEEEAVHLMAESPPFADEDDESADV